MKIRPSILFLAGLSSLAVGQDSPPTDRLAPPSIGIEVGQHAPAFTLPDQFGRQQSNETVQGSKGTVLLFFRSADW
jgi:hypothetical protein